MSKQITPTEPAEIDDDGMARYVQGIEGVPEGVPEVYVVVRKGCVAYVSSTGDIEVHVIDTDIPEHNEEGLLGVAESLPRVWQ